MRHKKYNALQKFSYPSNFSNYYIVYTVKLQCFRETSIVWQTNTKYSIRQMGFTFLFNTILFDSPNPLSKNKKKKHQVAQIGLGFRIIS